MHPATSRVLLATAVLAAAGLVGLAFALWAENGAAMFLSLVESGLAWCF